MPSKLRYAFLSGVLASVLTGALAVSPAAAANGDFAVVAEAPPGPWAQFDVERGRLYSHDGQTISVYKKGSWRALLRRTASVSGLSVYRDTLTWIEGGSVYQWRMGGKVGRLADVSAFEAQRNPDAGQQYGIKGLDPACQATVPGHLRWRSGSVSSHPISTVTTRSGVYVADYFGSTILHVSRSGAIRTVAVLPPASIQIDESLLHLHALEPCVAGATAVFPRKPMDVDVDGQGRVYFTAQTDATHHGTPGDGVYRLEKKARLTLLATGFDYLGPLAVSPDGAVYFTHGRFGEAVMQVGRDGTSTVVSGVPAGPSTVDWDEGRLYVGIIDYSGDRSPWIGAIRPRR